MSDWTYSVEKKTQYHSETGEPRERRCHWVKSEQEGLSILVGNEFDEQAGIEIPKASRLVAAAPDMLKALRCLRALYGEYAKNTEIRSILDAAIAKATGGVE